MAIKLNFKCLHSFQTFVESWLHYLYHTLNFKHESYSFIHRTPHPLLNNSCVRSTTTAAATVATVSGSATTTIPRSASSTTVPRWPSPTTAVSGTATAVPRTTQATAVPGTTTTAVPGPTSSRPAPTEESHKGQAGDFQGG